jgi:hypothetical protein
MRLKILYASLFFVIIAMVGFYISDPRGSKTNQSDNKPTVVNPVRYFSPTGILVYADSLDGANDTTSLKSRGYLPYYRGGGTQGSQPTWYQGQESVFSAFQGPSTGYMAANYAVVSGANNIDSWLVFPRLSGGIQAGDSLFFYQRSPDASTYPDSMRVMYSTSDSIPEGTWVELGRYKVSTSGWELKKFRAPTTSENGRFAIRYCVADGGPSGSNSDYTGTDLIQIVRTGSSSVISNSSLVETYSLSQNYPNPFNPVTMINFALPKSGFVSLKVYNALGNEVKSLVNEVKSAGNYSVNFNASEFSSGVYFYKLESNGFVNTKKMMLIK